MSTKTFKSANSDATKDLLVVVEVDEGVNIHTESPVGRRGVSIAPSDAPALALAILEAAGVTVAKDDFKQGSVEDLLIDAALHLKGAIRLQERITAEARERAELEAEALELHNAFWAGMEENQLDSWDEERGNAKNSWVSAARRAREMRAEK